MWLTPLFFISTDAYSAVWMGFLMGTIPMASQRMTWGGVVLMVPLFLLLPLLVVGLGLMIVIAAIRRMVLDVLAWLFLCTAGRNVIFVYSESANYPPYLNEWIFPNLHKNCIMLNLSRRRSWKSSTATEVFRMIGGETNYCPMGIILRPFRSPLAYRYFNAFKAFKHGRPEQVESITFEFLDALRKYAGHSVA